MIRLSALDLQNARQGQIPTATNASPKDDIGEWRRISSFEKVYYDRDQICLYGDCKDPKDVATDGDILAISFGAQDSMTTRGDIARDQYQ